MEYKITDKEVNEILKDLTEAPAKYVYNTIKFFLELIKKKDENIKG